METGFAPTTEGDPIPKAMPASLQQPERRGTRRESAAISGYRHCACAVCRYLRLPPGERAPNPAKTIYRLEIRERTPQSPKPARTVVESTRNGSCNSNNQRL